MALTCKQYLTYTKGEKPAVQAKRVFDELKSELGKYPNKKIGLIYSANKSQADALRAADNGGRMNRNESYNPAILNGACGQGAFFRELLILINQDGTFPKDRLKIFPISTSLRGGDDVPGNQVSVADLNEEINAIGNEVGGYEIDSFGSQITNSEFFVFRIGGENSPHFGESEVLLKGKSPEETQIDFLPNLQLEKGSFVSTRHKFVQYRLNQIIANDQNLLNTALATSPSNKKGLFNLQQNGINEWPSSDNVNEYAAGKPKLITALEKYKADRGTTNNDASKDYRSRLFFPTVLQIAMKERLNHGFSAEDKGKAASAAASEFNFRIGTYPNRQHRKTLTDKHKNALKQGNLGDIIKDYAAEEFYAPYFNEMGLGPALVSSQRKLKG